MDTLTGALPFHLEPGECFAGKYLIEGVLGSGGMSVVVAALHRGLQQKVAIKLLSAVNPLPADGVRRFVREARAAAALRSQHTARVVDVDVDEAGRHFIVMEHLDGEDLGQALRREGPLPIQTAVGYVVHACEAMAEAHPLGIVHRDLKPQNLFLTRRIDGTPLVKVLDFGVSKFSATTPSASKPSSLSSQNALLGTPHYMSPEQIRTPAEIDGRSDVWALGVILFELLTDQAPFEGDTIPDVIAAVLQGTPISPAVLRAEVPLELANVVLACLAKNVSDRVQSMGQLAQLLLPWAPPWALEAAAAAERLSGGSPGAIGVGVLRTEGLLPASFFAAGPLAASPLAASPLAAIQRAQGTARLPARRVQRRRSRKRLPAYALAATCGSFLVGWAWFDSHEAERVVAEPTALKEPASLGEAPPLATLTELAQAAPALLPASPEPARPIEVGTVADEPRPQLQATARPPATKVKRTTRVQAAFPSDPLVGRR